MERTHTFQRKISDLRREPRLGLRSLWVCRAESWAKKFRPMKQSSLIIREGRSLNVSEQRNCMITIGTIIMIAANAYQMLTVGWALSQAL